MTIEQLQYICMVAKTHSITTAAEQLYVTQQTISKAMNKLEMELDVKLLNRSHKGVTLTPEGMVFVEKADEIVEKFYSLYYMMRPDKYNPPLEGSLMVYTVSYVSALIGSFLLTSYHKKHQKVELRIAEKLTADVLTEMLDGSIQGIGLISAVDGDTGLGLLNEYDENIAYQLIYEDELQIFVSPKSRLAGKTVVNLQALHGLYAGYGSTPGTAYILERRYGIQTDVFTNSSNISLISQAVMDEIAFGITTKAIAAKDPFYNDFVLLSLEDHPKVEVYFIHKKEYLLNPLEEVFLEEVKKIFAIL